jgi:DNA-directed RNA polymerase subunit omega
MQQPSLDVLMRKVASKYELVVAASKRGRMLTEGGQSQADGKQLKPVSIALNEIADGRLTICHHEYYKAKR